MLHVQETNTKEFVSPGQAIRVSNMYVLVLVTGNAGTLDQSQREARGTVAHHRQQ